MTVNREIFRLALPNIISNITVPLLGMVDLALMGHLDSTDYVGAIALGGMIFNFIYWSFSFLRMGTSGFTAQAYGEKDPVKYGTVFLRAMAVALGSGIILIFLQVPIELISFGLIKGKESVEILGSGYFSIRIWAAPATLGLYVIYGWYIGMQNAKIPMALAILVNVINILFSSFFVIILGLNSDGVAMGTVIAQYAGFITGMVLILRKYKELLKGLINKQLLKISEMKLFFIVNRDIFLRTMLLLMVFTFFTAASAASDKASEDSMILNINTILLQFFTIFSFFIDGFAYAAEALTGKYIGAGDGKKLKVVLGILFKWSSILALVFSIVYFIAGDIFLSVFTDNTELINKAGEYVLWVVLVPVVSFAAFVWDGIFIGATESSFMRNSMVIAAVATFFPVYYIMRPFIGNHALWLAFVLFLLSRGVSLTFYWRKTGYYKIARSVKGSNAS